VSTPTRAALVDGSTLQPAVENGLSAVQANHRALIDATVHSDFADSLDLDAAVQAQFPQDNRWDYLLGHEPSRAVVGLEPHSAKQDEISTVIAKRKAARDQLRGHLKPAARISPWLWVASGKVHFADTEKARRQLDQEGITFVGRKVLAKHLPARPRRAT
jgi:hypothetical protein